MTMKYIIIHQVGGVYRDNNGVLEVAPLYKDNTFYEEEFGEVEEEMIGSETLTEPYCNATTFTELYKIIRSIFIKK